MPTTVWFSDPPVRANWTLATPPTSAAVASKTVMPLNGAPPEEGTTTDVIGGGLFTVIWTPALDAELPAVSTATLCRVYDPLGTVVVFSSNR